MTKPQQIPALFTVWTLDDTGSKSSHLGGALDEQSAVAIACALAQLFRVGAAVYDETNACVAYLSKPHEVEPSG